LQGIYQEMPKANGKAIEMTHSEIKSHKREKSQPKTSRDPGANEGPWFGISQVIVSDRAPTIFDDFESQYWIHIGLQPWRVYTNSGKGKWQER